MEIEKLAKFINEYLKSLNILNKEVEKEMINAVRWAYAKTIEDEVKKGDDDGTE